MNTAEMIKTVKFAEAKRIVRDKLATDNQWLVRGMVALYNRQTEDEKAAEGTRYLNRRGFNSSDAIILTSFAKQWQRRAWLSDKQMAILRRKMAKYAGQLARIARGEEVEATD
jgi:hypothetical protein